MADETERILSQVRLPRAYDRLDDDTFAKQLLQLFGSSTEASRLAEPLLSDQEVHVAQYIRQHLSYTVYLLSQAYEESPNLGYIVIPVARHLMTDRYLRGNYKRLDQVPNFPKSLISRLEQLDRETWFSQPPIGSHVVFDSQHANGQDAPSPVTAISISSYTTDSNFDLAKISTNDAPLSGQTHARVQIEASSHLSPSGRNYRRLEVLRLLARSVLNGEGENKASAMTQHCTLPTYTYTHKNKSYILLSPEISADVSPEDSGHHVCTLAQFITCRPDWWVPIPKDEKKLYIFQWMSCLAATIQLFHSLKVTHGEISTKRIYLIRNGKSIQIFLEGWHQSHSEARAYEVSRKRPNIKSNSKSFGYGMPESLGSDSRPGSRAKLSVPDLSSAEAGRLYDIKSLGDVFAELLLVMLGLSKDALSRLRRERLEWTKNTQARESNGDWTPIFYPKSSSSASEASGSSVASEVEDVNVAPASGPSTPSKETPVPLSISKSRNASTDKLSKTGSTKESTSRPGSIFGGMFSKSKEAPKSEPEPAPPKSNKSKMSYGIANKLVGSISSSNSTPSVVWWLEELKLMFPGFRGESDHVTWNKHSDLIGNHLLLLISAMVLPEPTLRPKADAVWKDITRIVNVFFKGTRLCCSELDGHLKEVHDRLRENILDDLYRRSIPDEEEEAWEGVGWDGPERFGPKVIGRRGEGALSECLFD